MAMTAPREAALVDLHGDVVGVAERTDPQPTRDRHPRQNKYFTPNCTCRELLATELKIRPNVALVIVNVGRPKLGLLSTFVASIRTSSDCRRMTRVRLETLTFRLENIGPR